MKQTTTLSLLLLSVFFTVRSIAQPCNLSGTYTIGPGGNYTTITAALTSLKTTGLGGPVILELKSNYVSNSETFPLSFALIPCISAVNNVTLRPQAGASNLQISAAVNTNLINLSNSRYIKIDGRPGGVGSSIALTIKNTAVGGTLVLFSNDASYDTLSYLNMSGTNNATNSGLVNFLGTVASVTNGNSYNVISNCNIGDANLNYLNAIYSSGTTGKKNSYNKIINCNIYNFYIPNSLSSANGIMLLGNNASWVIDGNSFYQTLSRGDNSSSFAAININSLTASGSLIQNNFIGGTAPGCGGAALSYNGFFNGINLFAGYDSVTVLQSNTISNINWKNYVGNEGFNGIVIARGKIDCGGATGNIIGSQSQQSNIVFTSKYFTSPSGNGISVTTDLGQTAADSFIIRNNKIGGIRTQQDGTNYLEMNFTGINLENLIAAQVEITNNQLGSPTVFNSIYSMNNVDRLKAIKLSVNSAGIGSLGYPLLYKISGNNIVNWSGRTVAIEVTGGIPQITNNNAWNLFTGNSPFINNGADITGISLQFVMPGALVSGNKLYSFAAYGGTNSSGFTGITADYSKGVTISKNFIHNFQSEANGSVFWGIIIPSNTYNLAHGNYNIQNNMISFGCDSTGFPLPTSFQVSGIAVPLDSSVISNNSVYIAGNTENNFETNALYLNQLRSRPSKVINNILQNNRYCAVNSFTRGSVIRIDSSIHDTVGLVLNNNIYYETGNNTYTGLFRHIGYNGILAWRAATGQDSNSVFASPNFINANGDANNTNLHLSDPTPAEAQGIPESTVTEDFDGQARAALTPVDIGADAGNFTLQDVDAPIITHNPLTGQVAGTVISYSVKITDNGYGIDTTGGNQPRMWFSRSYPSASSWFSVPGSLTTGSLKGGTWSFTPDYPAMGLPLVPGDSVVYYFVAQDKGTPSNIGYSNNSGIVHTNVITQVTAPTDPLRFAILGLFPDTVYVGSGQAFTSLTDYGGFFEATKSYIFNPASSSVQVIITSDLAETGVFDFKMAAAGPAIRIGTNTPVLKLVQNSYAINTAMIRLANIYNVSIDGSVNGSGRYLQFDNTHYNPAYCQQTIVTSGKLINFSIRNCAFSSNINSAYTYAVEINSQEIRNLRIRENIFSNSTGSNNSLPALQLGVSGANRDTTVISNNEFVNFSKSGAGLFGGNNAANNAPFVFDSNHFYFNSPDVPSTGNIEALNVTGYKTPMILTNNFIGGSAKFCAGNAWEMNNYGVTFRGINYLGVFYDSVSSIQRNQIRQIRLNGGNNYFTGIYIKDGNVNVGNIAGNTIGSATDDSSIVSSYQLTGIEGTAALYTIYNPVVKIENNMVAGSISGRFSGINFEGKKCFVNNNQVFNHGIVNSFLPEYKGIRIWLDSGLIQSNIIHNLHSDANTLNECFGMDIQTTGPSFSRATIARNRIYDLRNATYPSITGIRTGSGEYHIQNNQVSLDNAGNGSNCNIFGIYMTAPFASPALSTVLYNSIFISGSNGGTKNSYAVKIDGGGAITSFKNNLLYNNRIGGGANHLALGMLSTSTSPTLWPPGIAANNLYITEDTIRLNEWQTNGVVNWTQWKNLTNGEYSSLVNNTQAVQADSLFVSVAAGNLDINNNTATCWQVNQKARPVSSISDDYGAAGVRSVDVINGQSDIGADEFNTAVPAPPLPAALCPGGGTSISAGITAASYQWQMNDGSGFVNISNNSNYSGTNTASLQLTNIPSAWYGYQYRCVTNLGNSYVSALQFANTWTGAVNNAWENPGNWSCGSVPDSNTDVIINTGSCTLNVNTSCRTIRVSALASFTIAGGVVLTVLH